ncbi:MAG TPA: hypothetical protein DIW24_01160 [Bacteroidetes bacterium]|nr:hypothetical protein [Bacteroidota bacterium]HRR07678.1 DinB family protein [Rhodothermales bacterium]
MHPSKSNLIREIQTTFTQFQIYIESLPEEILFRKLHPDKWSIAENVEHLNICLNQTNLGLRLPKMLLKLMSGTSQRDSLTYEMLVVAYRNVLKSGGRAPERYQPQETGDRGTLLRAFAVEVELHLKILRSKWKDEQMDLFLMPHPLLRKITVRELIYFTMYHIRHHRQAIEVMVERMYNPGDGVSIEPPLGPKVTADIG